MYLYLGLSILRKNIANHLSKDYDEQLLNCCNDDCKIQINDNIPVFCSQF